MHHDCEMFHERLLMRRAMDINTILYRFGMVMTHFVGGRRLTMTERS